MAYHAAPISEKELNFNIYDSSGHLIAQGVSKDKADFVVTALNRYEKKLSSHEKA